MDGSHLLKVQVERVTQRLAGCSLVENNEVSPEKSVVSSPKLLLESDGDGVREEDMHGEVKFSCPPIMQLRKCAWPHERTMWLSFLLPP